MLGMLSIKKYRILIVRCFSIVCFVVIPYISSAQQLIKGTVYDDDSVEVIGAVVNLKGTNISAITDIDGKYLLRIPGSLASYDITIFYPGFEMDRVTLSASREDIEYSSYLRSPKTISLDELVISASRRSEKISESPASISRLPSDNILAKGVFIEPNQLLKNIQGVQMITESVNRSNIQLRGQVLIDETTTQVFKDYRPLVSSSTSNYTSSRTPVSSIDLDRVEVLRGPAGALYGPGVTAGVVHFISKDLFEHQGGTVEVSYGNRNIMKGDLRYAKTNSSETFGFKVVGSYRSGDDWNVNFEGIEALQQDTSFRFPREFYKPINEGTPDASFDTLSEGLTAFESFFAELTLSYRPNDDFRLTWVGSIAENKGNTNILSYEYARVINNQIRMNFQNLFLSVNYELYPAAKGDFDSPGYVGSYRDGTIRFDGRRDYLDIQPQYWFEFSPLQTEFTIGLDYKAFRFDADESLVGRYKGRNDYDIYGGYLQSKTGITEKLDLIIAGRYDYFSAFKSGGISPRAGLVFEVNERNSFRASFNRSFSAMNQVNAFEDQVFFDINQLVPGTYVVQTLGGVDPITFDNPLVWNFFRWDFGTLDPVNPVFELNEIMSTLGLTPFASNPTTDIVYRKPGTLIVFDVLETPNLGDEITDLRSQATTQAKLTVTNSIEIGYQGIIANKLSIATDLWLNTVENIQSDQVLISPYVTMPDLIQDFENAFAAEGTDQAVIDFALPLIRNLFVGENGEAIALGFVRTDNSQEVPGSFFTTGYQNFGRATYWGADIALEFYLLPVLSIFTNYSYLNQTEFSPEDIGETESGFTFNLNIPKHRIRTGINLLSESGFYGTLAFLWDDSFNATNGTFDGRIPARGLVDSSMGYRFEFGLDIAVSSNNVLDKKYTALPFSPMISRTIFGRLRYNF